MPCIHILTCNQSLLLGSFGATNEIKEETLSAVLIPIPPTLLAGLIPQTTSGNQNTIRVPDI